MGTFRATALGSNTELFTLPLELPLADWDDLRIVHVPRGLSRHVVRFVDLGGEIFAIKEATDRYVLREHGLLRQLGERSVPAVEPYGTIVERISDTGTELGGLLVTRHLTFSQPYRALFTGRELPDRRRALLDALAGLFVRLHLAGFYWGDCSLSNALFRRDAGGLAAYLVDAETGELHATLSDGQRSMDIDIARMNITGDLVDLQAAGLVPADVDVVEMADLAQSRYESLWHELTQDVLIPRGENYLINQRLRRLNDLGFDVGEMTITTEADRMRLKFDPQVVDAGHHQRLIFALTGLRVQANQARDLLADLWRYKAKWEDGVGHPVPDDLAARRWLDEKFYATLALVPTDLRVKLPDAELFHEINEHRWLLSEDLGADVGRSRAVASYVESVLRDVPDTRVDLTGGPPTEEFAPIFE